MSSDQKIESIILAEAMQPGGDAALERERESAIRDLCSDNRFAPVGNHAGPFRICLGIADDRLDIEVRGPNGDRLVRHAPSLRPLRRLIRDYVSVRDGHLDAVRIGSRARIEAIDVGRRALHDEGAEALRQGLESAMAMDAATARRLFTLICAIAPRAWLIVDAADPHD